MQAGIGIICIPSPYPDGCIENEWIVLEDFGRRIYISYVEFRTLYVERHVPNSRIRRFVVVITRCNNQPPFLLARIVSTVRKELIIRIPASVCRCTSFHEIAFIILCYLNLYVCGWPRTINQISPVRVVDHHPEPRRGDFCRCRFIPVDMYELDIVLFYYRGVIIIKVIPGINRRRSVVALCICCIELEVPRIYIRVCETLVPRKHLIIAVFTDL